MRVTIGIAFLNSETTLADAIRSVFAQTYQDWELVLVDDGAKDGSLQIAEAVRDPRVRVLSDGVRRGLAARLNEITETASGEYIARMDADDIMHPTRIARQIEYLDANPCVDVVGAVAYVIDGENIVTGIRSLSLLDTSASTVTAHGLYVHPTVTGRLSWFQRNPYDATFLGSEDHELWCRTLSKSRFGKIIEPLLYYRENSRPPDQYLEHYLKAANHVRRVYSIHGPALVGRSQTRALTIRSHAKGAAYRLCTALGVQRLLVRSRNSVIDPEELTIARTALDQVLATDVPGLTDSAPALLEAA